MVSKPWIKIFVGDWIRDTRKLSMRARGAYADLKMNLWISDITGVITGDITDVSLLLGVSVDETAQLMDELMVKKVFKIELCYNSSNNKCYNITDETMVAQIIKSTTKSKAGAEGMKKRYQKNPPKSGKYANGSVITDDITSDIATDITYNNSNNGSDNNSEKGGGAGGGKGDQPLTVYNASQILSIQDCLRAFIETNICGIIRDLVKRRMMELCPQQLQTDVGLDNLLRRWGERFNETLSGRLMTDRSLSEWTSHFQNWINLQDLKSDPNDNANRTNHTGQTTQPRGNAHGARGGASINDLEGLKRGGSGDGDQRTEFTEAEVVK
jgi:uncharacterized protein YdaU (DUF1376 family)